MGLIHDIPTCAELVTRIEREANETIQRLAQLSGIGQQRPRL